MAVVIASDTARLPSEAAVEAAAVVVKVFVVSATAVFVVLSLCQLVVAVVRDAVVFFGIAVVAVLEIVVGAVVGFK